MLLTNPEYNNRTPLQWVRAQLHRASPVDEIRERLAAIGAESPAGTSFANAALDQLAVVAAIRHRTRGPAQKKLLQDPSQKLSSFDPDTVCQRPAHLPDLFKPTAETMPAHGVKFDVDWDNVSAFERILRDCKVAEPGDNSGDWHLVQQWCIFMDGQPFPPIPMTLFPPLKLPIPIALPL